MFGCQGSLLLPRGLLVVSSLLASRFPKGQRQDTSCYFLSSIKASQSS
nr:MAG TPA: hypothetical protein [Bacteriophage sp.]